jgi:hypothetical protein
VRLLGRLVLIPIGLGLAIPFGFLVLLIGAAFDPTARDLLGALGLAGLDAIADAFAEGGAPDARAVALMVDLWTGLLVLLVAPPVAAALLGELAGWRSFAWHGGATGAFTAALPWLSRSRLSEQALPAESRITALLFLAGAVSGLMYWMIAGRGAAASPPRVPTFSLKGRGLNAR